MRLDLSRLNAAQRQAVAHEGGPLLVLAGAGTGKTRVIVYRIADLIRRGVCGDRILGITFTNKAAREMRERLLRMYPDLDPRPWLSTFHALGLRILRDEHEQLGFRSGFPIYDESDVRGVLTETLRELAGMNTAESSLENVRREISIWKNRFRSPEQALDEADDDDALLRARAYARYQDRLQGLNAVDFDDLIHRTVQLLEQNADVAERWTRRFDHVLVDEYQDSNTAQYRLARLLAGPFQNLTVVGDDDQSIYAFRGAEVDRILHFRRDFPCAEVVTLEDNYRSVGTILEAACAVIGHNPSRHGKELRSVRGAGEVIPFLTLEHEDAEAEEVVGRVLDRQRAGVPYADQAILMRSAVQARPFEEKLRFHQVPYTIIGGQSFFDRREIRDLLAYLRLLVTPDDDIAALRILNTPRRGWGRESRERLDRFARAQNCSILEALVRVAEIDGVSAAARGGTTPLVAALRRGAEDLERGARASVIARQLLADVDYAQALREGSNDPERVEFRRRGVEGFLESLDRYAEKGGALRSFLDGITLDSRDDDRESEPALTLLTFHGAKGLEFKRVFLVGVEDELIPHKRAVAEGGERAIEEERRLFYVALTRAQDGLTLTRAAHRRRYGRDFDTLESRFAAEIPERLVVRRDLAAEADEPLDEDATLDRLAELRARFSTDEA